MLTRVLFLVILLMGCSKKGASGNENCDLCQAPTKPLNAQELESVKLINEAMGAFADTVDHYLPLEPNQNHRNFSRLIQSFSQDGPNRPHNLSSSLRDKIDVNDCILEIPEGIEYLGLEPPISVGPDDQKGDFTWPVLRFAMAGDRCPLRLKVEFNGSMQGEMAFTGRFTYDIEVRSREFQELLKLRRMNLTGDIVASQELVGMRAQSKMLFDFKGDGDALTTGPFELIGLLESNSEFSINIGGQPGISIESPNNFVRANSDFDFDFGNLFDVKINTKQIDRYKWGETDAFFIRTDTINSFLQPPVQQFQLNGSNISAEEYYALLKDAKLPVIGDLDRIPDFGGVTPPAERLACQALFYPSAAISLNELMTLIENQEPTNLPSLVTFDSCGPATQASLIGRDELSVRFDQQQLFLFAEFRLAKAGKEHQTEQVFADLDNPLRIARSIGGYTMEFQCKPDRSCR